MTTLRVGVLGAARITPTALIRPARAMPDVTVAAVAARDVARAQAFAGRHGIPVVHRSYAELIDDPGIDAVYVPLPNALHAEWALAAIAAGKHVLCEKPMTSNADEARAVAAAADASGLVVMEAFHYRYHPLARRALELVATIGPVRHIHTRLCFPLPRFGDIRYRFDLAGGAMMDAGCYAVHFLRHLGGAALPGARPEVVAARAKLRSPQVDRYLTAGFRFTHGDAPAAVTATGQATASIWSSRLLGLSARVVGEAGELRVFNYALPQAYNRLTVRVGGRTRHERIAGEPSYTYQLRAFADAVRHGGPNLTPASDAVPTMALIDDAYRAAGLLPRGTAVS
jgi:predicted dehydrogenase